MRELDLLEDEEKIGRILSRFDLYSSDILELDLEETDQVLLWLVDILVKTHLARDRKESDNLWDIVIQLKNIYRELSIQYESKWLFPKTKEAMLLIILDQWSVTRYNNTCHQDILKFIWDIYNDQCPAEERNIINNILKEKLKNADSYAVKGWMKWIWKIMQRSGDNEQFRSIHKDLIHLFITAWARRSSFDEILQDIKNGEIVSALGLEDADDDVISVLANNCRAQKELKEVVAYCVKKLNELSDIPQGKEITYKLGMVDVFEIRLFEDEPDISGWRIHKFYETVRNEMLRNKNIRELIEVFEREITLVLVIADKSGSTVLEKHYAIKTGKVDLD